MPLAAGCYYRLNTYTIVLPPLRQRATDIPLLVEHYLQRFNRELGKTVTEVATEALEMMLRYPWPGNVRELQSVLKQALLHATGDVLLAGFLPSRLRTCGRPAETPSRAENGRSPALEGFIEKQLRANADELYGRSLAVMERMPAGTRLAPYGRQSIPRREDAGHHPRKPAQQDPALGDHDQPGGQRGRAVPGGRGLSPSRRVWEEGGYEGGYLGEYGLPAMRWAGDGEDRVTAGVGKVAAAVTARFAADGPRSAQSDERALRPANA